MRFLKARPVAVIIVLTLLGLAGCNSNDQVARNTNAPATAARPAQPASSQQQPATPASSVRRITTVELEDAIKKGQAVVVDVRNDAAFKQGRIKDAILIPYNEVASHLDKLPRDKMIVTYCS